MSSSFYLPDISYERAEHITSFADHLLEKALSSERNQKYVELIRELEVKYRKASGKKFEPVWFFSTGRCGTYSLFSLFSQNSGTVSFHRSGKPLINRNEIFYGFTECLAQDSWAEEVVFDYLTDQVIGEYLSALTRNKQFICVDNHQAAWLPVIIKLFPESSFVHLIRDPLDEMLSWLSKNIFSSVQLHPARLHRQAFEKYREVSIVGSDLPIVEQLAWHWKNINIYIDIFLCSSLVKRAYVVTSEELFSASASIYELFSSITDLRGISFEQFKDHYSTKHNELIKQGEYKNFNRSDFDHDWINRQDNDFRLIAEKFAYLL